MHGTAALGLRHFGNGLGKLRRLIGLHLLKLLHRTGGFSLGKRLQRGRDFLLTLGERFQPGFVRRCLLGLTLLGLTLLGLTLLGSGRFTHRLRRFLGGFGRRLILAFRKSFARLPGFRHGLGKEVRRFAPAILGLGELAGSLRRDLRLLLFEGAAD